LSMASTAQTLKFAVMVGCMMATSLSMAPAFLVAQRARYVDLDGPLWIKKDRDHGLTFNNQTVQTPKITLWG
ncbi:MAG: dipeptide epimerase, partial [Pseudomonadota bacterium]